MRRRPRRPHRRLPARQAGLPGVRSRERLSGRRHLPHRPVQGLPLRHRRPPVLHQDRPVQALWDELLGAEFISVPRLSRIHYRRQVLRLSAEGRRTRCGASGPVERHPDRAQLPPGAAPARTRSRRTSSSGSPTASAAGSIEIFFKTYTEKVWGIPCTEIRAEWAAQRIQGLSLARAHSRRRPRSTSARRRSRR